MATRKRREADVEASAEAWARSTVPLVGRACLTCAWAKRNPAGGRWLAKVLELKRAGLTLAALSTIREKLIEDFGYPDHSVSAMENHYKHGPR